MPIPFELDRARMAVHQLRLKVLSRERFVANHVDDPKKDERTVKSIAIARAVAVSLKKQLAAAEEALAPLEAAYVEAERQRDASARLTKDTPVVSRTDSSMVEAEDDGPFELPDIPAFLRRI